MAPLGKLLKRSFALRHCLIPLYHSSGCSDTSLSFALQISFFLFVVFDKGGICHWIHAQLFGCKNESVFRSFFTLRRLKNQTLPTKDKQDKQTEVVTAKRFFFFYDESARNRPALLRSALAGALACQSQSEIGVVQFS